MNKNASEVKEMLKNIKKEDIHFKKHFYDKQKEDRPYLNENLIIDSLRNISNFLGVQDQSKRNIEKYRIGIKLSNEYDLVVIIEIENKGLYIKTAWKTSRKWQKATQK
mgnify:CR=1 FL=1